VKRLDTTLALCLLLVPIGAAGTPLLSIDLDPETPGIQSSRSVAAGGSFDVEVLLTGDGATLFDTLGLDVLFNDSGSALGFTPPALAGAMADRAIDVLDIIAFAPIKSGSALASALEPPPMGFASGLGGVVYTSLGGPFDLVGDGVEVSLIRASFLALTQGRSTMAMAPIFGGPLLAFEGNAVSVDLAFGELTVTASGPTPASEPSLPLLVFAAILGLAAKRRA
jgi:hypothetical protein